MQVKSLNVMQIFSDLQVFKGGTLEIAILCELTGFSCTK